MNELKEALKHIKQKFKEIEASIYLPVAQLKCEAWLTEEPVPFSERRSGEYSEVAIGQKWGRKIFDCAWMRFSGSVPESAKGQPVAAKLDIDGEMLVVTDRGEPVRGLTTYCSEFFRPLGEPGKTILPLFDRAQGGETVDFWADCAYNDLFGKLLGKGSLEICEICVVQPAMRKLYYDMEVLINLAEHLPEDSARRGMIIRALERAVQVLTDMSDERALGASFALKPELERRSGDYGFTMSAVGHAHIDLMWLWPERETVRKGLRTFATVMRNMEKYDNYIFGASQPQLYDWVKKAAPGLYEQIRARVNEGRWELQGGMWVEADDNMAGGEALVRQIFWGKRYFAGEFGQDVATLWLPDDFGYSAQIPQLMEKSGIHYFMNTRAMLQRRWEFPYSSFWWQGLDGSKVLVHVPPEGYYNSAALPESALAAEKNFKEVGIADGALMVYGIGDGGGGPGEEHLERLSREGDLMGMPPVRNEQAITFFERLRRSRVELPTWSGEIFVDQFQGTYTSQEETKRANRHMESALRMAEIIMTAMCLRGAEYPRAQMEQIWKRALLYQFHDILPGSSIGRVYKEVLAGYAELNRQLSDEVNRRWDGDNGLDVALNPHAWTIDMWLDSREGGAQGEGMLISLAPMSATSLLGAVKAELPARTADAVTLENDRLRIKFDERGRIASIFDKKQRWESLRGAGNQLSVYQDDGDAWVIGEDTLKRRVGTFTQQSVTAEITGAKCRRTAVYAFGDSTLKQTVEITAGSARVDFVTEIDWHESNKLLRAEFPVNVNSGRFLCDIQFGHVERPVNRNTGREQGMFEVYAHKWADLSQHNCGAALMLDGGYGHACLENLMSVSLLRAPGYPDENADRGAHTLRYAFYPHAGDLEDSDVMREAYEFHQPPVVRQGMTFGPLCWLDVDNVIIEAVKMAEDSEDVVLRMYECKGASCRAVLHTGFRVFSASICDLMERITSPLPVSNGDMALEFAPYEIKTVMLTPQRNWDSASAGIEA